MTSSVLHASMRPTVVVLAVALVWVVDADGVQDAKTPQAQPLSEATAIAKQLNAGGAAFLSGKSPVECFKPWLVADGPDEEARIEQLRKKLTDAKVTGIESAFIQFELFCFAGGKCTYRVTVDLAVNEKEALVWSIRGAPATSALKSALDTNAFKDQSAAIGKTAGALVKLLSAESKDAVPLMSSDKALVLLGANVFTDDAKVALEKVPRDVETIRKKLAELKPEEWKVRIEEQHYVLRDAEKKVLGFLNSKLTAGEDGKLKVRLAGIQLVE